MGIKISSNFDVRASLPLDDRDTAQDLVARDAILPIKRYDGMKTYITSTQQTFQLQGGITNGDWVLISTPSGVLGVEKWNIEAHESLVPIGINVASNYVDVYDPNHRLEIGNCCYFVGSTGNDAGIYVIQAITALGGDNFRVTFDDETLLLSPIFDGVLVVPINDVVTTALDVVEGIQIQVFDQDNKLVYPKISYVGNDVKFSFSSPYIYTLTAIIQGKS